MCQARCARRSTIAGAAALPETRRPYPTGLSNAEWALLKPLLENLAGEARPARPAAEVAAPLGRRRGLLPAPLRLPLVAPAARIPAPSRALGPRCSAGGSLAWCRPRRR